MDIFRYALQFEKDGESFYREQAGQVRDRNLKDILLLLAREEQNHFRLIKGLKEKSAAHPATIFISDVQNIFTRMTAKNENFIDEKKTITAILERALKIEDDSIRYYAKAKGEVDGAPAGELLSVLEHQEQAHYSLLSSLLEYYETPRLWMEQAEFNNIKEY